MVQLSILYPKREDATFNWDYYLNTHMPLSLKLQGEAVQRVTIARGIENIPSTPVAHVAITTFLYDSVDAFMAAFMPHASVLQGDMPNYTNIQPVIQFSEVLAPGPAL